MENIQNSAVEELPVPMSKDDAAKQHKKQLKKRTPSSSDEEEEEDDDDLNNENKKHKQEQREKKKPNKSKNNHQPPKKYASSSNSGSSNSGSSIGANDDFKYAYQKYTKEANLRDDEHINGHFYDPESGRKYSPTDEDWHERVHERVRRAAGSGPRREDNKNTCSLYIQTDPLIWRHIREGIAEVC